MKSIIVLVMHILIIVSLLLGIFQVKAEEERLLLDEIRRKAEAVAESMDFSAKYIFSHNDLNEARQIVDELQQMQELMGCIIYDKDGKIVAMTERFSGWKDKDNAYINEAIAGKTPRGAEEKFNQDSVYSYIYPVLDDKNNVMGLIEIIYDTSYAYPELSNTWKRLSTILILLAVFIGIVIIFVERQFFTLPVKRLTRWFQYFQKGEIDTAQPIKEEGELGKLASEVEQVALSLRVSRKVVSEEAQARLEKEGLWTDSKLRDLVRAKLGENSLFLVSNREPYVHITGEGGGAPKCIRPAGGLVTAVDPMMRACGGTWIAHGSGNADKEFVNSKNKLGVPPEDNRYILKRVWLSEEEEEGYYYGFSNEGLWPLCHITHTRPIFRESDWQMYKKVNKKFAEAVLEELPANNPYVFVHDYHLTLLPGMIKEERPDATIALFWHIPWPNPEVFSVCPYQKDILDGMLGSDLIGFHVQYHCNNFLDTANRLLEARVDAEKFSIVRLGKETFVRAFPISINGYFSGNTVKVESDQLEKIREEFDLKNKIVGVGVDRIDYTKGIIERILAVDRFLEKYPEYINKFVFIQIGAPSRTLIKRYQDLMSEINELIEKKNLKYSDGNWKPIIYIEKQLSSQEIAPFYALSDFCIVSSLHDGMNLVAKEYVASKRDLSGALILSSFTGAARELTDAIQINPYSIEEFADSIKLAVEMPDEEKRRRMESMRKVVSSNNVYRWAADIITELTSIKKV